MNEIWNVVEPYVISALKALLEGTALVLILRLLIKQFLTKASTIYDVNLISNKVADKLGGKTINVDVTAVTEKRLSETTAILHKDVKTIADEVNSFKRLLVCIGKSLTYLKALSDDDRAELETAIKDLDDCYIPPDKEVIATVKLEPITLNEPSVSAATDTVNFG